MTQRDRFRRAHRHIDAALDDRRPRRLQRDQSRLNVVVDDHPVGLFRNGGVGMLPPPYRAKGVALVHGTAIEEVTGDATVGVKPALNLARRNAPGMAAGAGRISPTSFGSPVATASRAAATASNTRAVPLSMSVA